MRCEEILNVLESLSGPELAFDWDNVGLLVGERNQQIHSIYVALDASDEVIEHAIKSKADLLITHHPLIFSGLKKVTSEEMIGRRTMQLIRHHISYIAMHTNFDVTVMADLAAARMHLFECQILQKSAQSGNATYGIGKIGLLPSQMTLKECAEMVKRVFELEGVKVFGDLEQIVKKAAITPGSGKSTIPDAIRASADVLITGDIDHHNGIDAVANGLCIIDAGHYGIEHIFTSYMTQFLQQQFPDLLVTKEPDLHPYKLV
ncbi:MAG: Nif3-like dinuclear metal center hexameric protein [Lachnospiraceae bacterium]